MSRIDQVELKIPAKSQYISIVRLLVSGLATRAGFSFEEIEDLKIAASEAVTNAVQHAYNEDGEVSITCSLYKDKIELVVEDEGASFDVEETKKDLGPYDGKYQTEEIQFLREGGLGLYLIETLTDEVTITEEGGVTVRMIKYLSGERGDKDVRTISS